MALNFLNQFLKWGYGPHNGPHTWSNWYPIAEEGVRQSPVDVPEKEVEQDSSLHPISCNYGDGEYCKMNNTGASWMLNLWPEETWLRGGPLQGEYRGFQVHAHWGSSPGQGSEHTLSGQSFDAEIHIVHYNTKYENSGESLDKHDGLAVLGMLVKTGKPHPHFDIIARHLCEIQENGSEIMLEESFNPELLLPEGDRSYYTYPGSLTTPPLFESVTWILFCNPIELSEDQINKMRSLTTGCESSKCMVDNYRPPLDKKGRSIKKFCQ